MQTIQTLGDHDPLPRPLVEMMWVVQELTAAGRDPSLSEIAEELEISRTEVHRRLGALEARGRVRRLPGRWRAIEVLAPVPLPDFADQAIEVLRPAAGGCA